MLSAFLNESKATQVIDSLPAGAVKRGVIRGAQALKRGYYKTVIKAAEYAPHAHVIGTLDQQTPAAIKMAELGIVHQGMKDLGITRGLQTVSKSKAGQFVNQNIVKPVVSRTKKVAAQLHPNASN